MLPAERLQALERALQRLEEDARDATLLVEGPKDVAALEELHIGHAIEVTNQGMSLVDLADALSRRHRRIILLTDWDRTGGRLHHALMPLLLGRGVKVDQEHRRRIAGLVGGDGRDVESLPRVLENLRRQAGATS